MQYFEWIPIYSYWRVKGKDDKIWHTVKRYQWNYQEPNNENWTFCGQYLVNPDLIDMGSAYYDPKTKEIPEPVCSPCMRGLLEAKRDRARREAEHWVVELEKL